ncbi:uncharacterized protein [Littorina saxatilis]|uniref:uncharacterized protein n=1 Tax=Littorina saxatilis TaxID=31220 RepID=UPI0038B4F9AC
MSYQAETVSLTLSRTEQTPIEEVQTAESEPEQFIEFNDVKELTLEYQARLLNEKDTEKSPDATETCVEKGLKTNEKMPYSKDQICHILPAQLVKLRLTVHPGGVASSSAKGWIRIMSNSGKEKTLLVTEIYPATTDISLHGLPEQASVNHEKEAYCKPIQEEHHQVRELTLDNSNRKHRRREKHVPLSPS